MDPWTYFFILLLNGSWCFFDFYNVSWKMWKNYRDRERYEWMWKNMLKLNGRCFEVWQLCLCKFVCGLCLDDDRWDTKFSDSFWMVFYVFVWFFLKYLVVQVRFDGVNLSCLMFFETFFDWNSKIFKSS